MTGLTWYWVAKVIIAAVLAGGVTLAIVAGISELRLRRARQRRYARWERDLLRKITPKE